MSKDISVIEAIATPATIGTKEAYVRREYLEHNSCNFH